MNISIFGLGYVGTVSAACFANEGNNVIGVDINKSKIDLINQGKSPIVECGLDDLIKKNINSKNLTATSDYKFAVENSDISIICVGTPSNKNGSLDLSYIFNVIKQIASVLKEKNERHLIVIRSTVLPGTVDGCYKILKGQIPDKENFIIVSNPEFLREGSAVEDFYNPPYTVIGTDDERAGNILKEVYSFLDTPFYIVNIKIAEMLKYANNIFHALKICYANEIGNICKELGIDGHKVLQLVCEDKKLNLSPYYMKPGFAFGGSCLPKDVRAIKYEANHIDLNLPLIESISESNKFQIERGINLIKDTGKKKIGILGLAFKANTDDLRESPVVELTEFLIGKGYDVKIFDDHVNVSFLTGSNKEYIENQIPHISNYLSKELNPVIENSDVLVIGNNNPEFKKIIENNPGKIIIDLVRLDSGMSSNDNYIGICW